jgi:hypothetical protein
MSKLTIQQRKQLQEICKETLIKKLSQKEAHIFVNSKLQFTNISFDYVQKVRNEVSKNAKEQLLHLEKDQYALIQSLFFDRKDELEEMQKVLWSIIDNNNNKQLNNPPDIQIKAIEQLHIVSDKLVHLYHSLPYEVEFGSRRHFYISREGEDATILTPEQQQRLDKFEEASYHVQYKKDFAEMRKKYPMLSDDEINEKIEEKYFEEEREGEQGKGEGKEEDTTTTEKEEEAVALLT